MHLRNPGHPGLEKFDYGKNYQYPHRYEEGYVPGINYLPRHLIGSRYYYPSNRGYEKIIKARLEYWRNLSKSKAYTDLECPKKEQQKKKNG